MNDESHCLFDFSSHDHIICGLCMDCLKPISRPLTAMVSSVILPPTHLRPNCDLYLMHNHIPKVHKLCLILAREKYGENYIYLHMSGVSAHSYWSHIYRYYYNQLSSSVKSWLISGDIDDQLPSKSVSCTGFQSSGSDVLVEVFILSIGGVFRDQSACYRLPSQLFLTNRFVAVLGSVLKIKRATW